MITNENPKKQNRTKPAKKREREIQTLFDLLFKRSVFDFIFFILRFFFQFLITLMCVVSEYYYFIFFIRTHIVYYVFSSCALQTEMGNDVRFSLVPLLCLCYCCCCFLYIVYRKYHHVNYKSEYKPSFDKP